MKRKDIIYGTVGLILLGTTATGFLGWHSSNKQINELEKQLSVLEQHEKRSVVMRSLSLQLEEIAYQQKEISDEQREEALQQTRIANELRNRAEEERQNAIIAQKAALNSERNALDAYDQVKQQRQIAEHQRIQAEFSKRVADTLSYISLGRSLGSLAITQYYIGNQELSDLLSYAAYLFTDRYGGDVYNPSVYQPLSLASRSKNEWAVHNSAITNIKLLTKDGKNIYTISNYGEIIRHEKQGKKLISKTLFFDKKYDFRNTYTDQDKNIVYALSRTGHLVIKTRQDHKVLELNGISNPMKMSPLDGNTLIIGEDCIALFEPLQEKITGIRHLNSHIICSGSISKHPILFDDKGKMYEVKSLDDIVIKDVPFTGQVTAYVGNQRNQAFGMIDGTIYVMNQKGNIRRFVGHRSRISKLRFNGNNLYSSSYDGTVNLWVVDSEKPEPITLYSDNSWILHFVFDKDVTHLWIGDQNGNLSEALISVPIMVETVKKKLKRDFTESEWNYYIGPNIPFESFISARKEVKL